MYQQWGNVAFICRRATALFLPNPNFARTQHPQQYAVAAQPNPMDLAPAATQRVIPPLLPLAPAACLLSNFYFEEDLNDLKN